MPHRSAHRVIFTILASLLLSACPSDRQFDDRSEDDSKDYRDINLEEYSAAIAAVVGMDVLHANGWSGDGQLVGIMEEGVDVDHPDLQGAIHQDSHEYLIDDDRRDIIRYTAYHGTLSAGVIAARKNGHGVYGMAHEVQLLSMVSDYWHAQGMYADEVFIEEWSYLLERGVTAVMACCFGGLHIEPEDFENNPLVAVFDAMVENDMVIFVPAGNSGEPVQPVFSPAELDRKYGHMVVHVGSIHPDTKEISGFSNRAGDLASRFIVVPGENLRSTKTSWRGTDHLYATTGGTSFSAPLALGVFAALKQAFPEKANREILQAMFDGAEDLGEPGIDDIYGHGLVNAETAFSLLQ